MILFFDLNELIKQSNGSDSKLVWLLYKWWRDKNTLPRRGDKHILRKPLNGVSWLINPEPIFERTLDQTYVAQYIQLAALRDITLYKQFGKTSLLRSYFVDIDINNIKTNPLLEITDSEINFKFEK